MIMDFSYCLQHSGIKFRVLLLQACMPWNLISSQDYERDGGSDQGSGEGEVFTVFLQAAAYS
jgi:hypothetical protein